MADNIENADARIEAACNIIAQRIGIEMRSRGMRAANELRNSSQLVLRGQRSGRRYRVPGTGAHYTASAPGEPPAVRTGTFRVSWQPKQRVDLRGNNEISVTSYIESRARTDNGHNLASVLENGTSRMAPRPYKEKIQQEALPNITRIYEEPYF